jgi:hypothetical protein
MKKSKKTGKTEKVKAARKGRTGADFVAFLTERNAQSRDSQAAEIESRNEQRRKKAQAPLEAMIASGKDRREAALVFTIAKVLDRIGWKADDSEIFSTMSPKEQACHSSIQWNIDEVLQVLICHEETYGILSPKSPFFHPDFADWWREFRLIGKDLFNFTEAMGESVGEILPSKPARTRFGKKRIFRRVEHLQGEYARKECELYATIAFCFGIQARKRQIEREADRIKFDLINQTTMKNPDPVFLFSSRISPEALRAQLER